MAKLHVANPDGRDATIDALSAKVPSGPKLGLPGKTVTFRRYVAATEDGLHEALEEKFGEAYGEALIEGDPEVALEDIGQPIGRTDTVFLSSDGEVLFAAPELVEVVLGPDGEEKERREPVETPQNVNDELPIRWTKMRMSKADAVRRFAFKRTMQLRHVDGLTYDYLYAMAKELHEAELMVYIGAGAKGRDALIMQANGTPYRGFLEGRIDGTKYKLLLHLSNMELKRPEGA